jgi:uncharacterized protein YggT (Ycf19 family)
MIEPVLAVTGVQAAEFVKTLVILYIVLIFVRVLISFAPRIPYNPALRAFLDYVESVTDPYLNLFRRVLPMARVGPAALDLSPMIATMVLIVVGLWVLVPAIAAL